VIVLKHYLFDFNWYRAITQCTRTVNVLTTKLGIKIVGKGIPTRRSKPSALSLFCGPKGHSSLLLLSHVYCGYGRPSQLLLSSCLKSDHFAILYISWCISFIYYLKHIPTPNFKLVFGRPFVKHFVLCYRTIVLPVCL